MQREPSTPPDPVPAPETSRDLEAWAAVLDGSGASEAMVEVLLDRVDRRQVQR